MTKNNLFISGKRKIDSTEAKKSHKKRKNRGGIFHLRFPQSDNDDERIGIVYSEKNPSSSLKDIIKRDPNYLSPSKTEANSEISPTKLKTKTPRKTQLTRMAKVIIEKDGDLSEFYVFQKEGNFIVSPNKEDSSSREKIKKRLFAPISDKKMIPEVKVTSKVIKEAKKHPRKSAKWAYNGVSANQASLLSSSSAERPAFEWSHLLRRLNGGNKYENNKDTFSSITTANPEGHNTSRLVFVEEIPTDIILNGKTLYYSAESLLVKDDEGHPTHLGGKETSTWHDGKSKITVILDGQNPEVPLKCLTDLMRSVYSYVFAQETEQEVPSTMTFGK